MLPGTDELRRLAAQAWARRRDAGRVEFWQKTARITGRLMQSWLWPERWTRDALQAFERRPFNLHVETTNACNANCVFCAYQFMERPRKVMKMDVFRLALAQYVEIGGGDLMLEVVVGDPILDPTFLQKVAEARREARIAEIETITNGIAIDRLGAEALVRSGLSRIRISTSGFDRASYERIYRSKEYDRMRRNVLALLRANRAAGSPVDIVLGIRTDRPLDQVMADADFAEIRDFEPTIDFTYSFDDWSGRIDFTQLSPGFVKRAAPRQSEPCIWLYDGPIVFANGDVGLCGCRDVDAKSELVVGNLRQQHLLEIWHSANTKRLRERFYGEDKPDICKSCTMYRNLDILRGPEGLRRAKVTRQRFAEAQASGRPRPAVRVADDVAVDGTA